MKRYLIFLSALFGLSVGCHAASPSFGSFNQTYFTTNNLFISIRTNWISTNSITTLIVTNLYVTNLYSTNIIVNGTNVATFGDLLWTNDTAIHPDGVIKIKPDIGYSYISPSNTYTRGWFGNQPLFVGLQLGTNFFDNLTNSSWRVLSATNDATQVILQLGQGEMSGQDLWIMSITNTPWNGRFTLPADSVVPGFGVVKLNNNQDWVGANGSVMLLKWSNPNWWEVGRWTAGSTNQPQSVVMNPTDTYLPYRQSAGVFADSLLQYRETNYMTLHGFGAGLFIGSHAEAYYGGGLTGEAIVAANIVAEGDPDDLEMLITSVDGSNSGEFHVSGSSTASTLQLSVNGASPSQLSLTSRGIHQRLDSGDFHINFDPFGLVAAAAPFYFNQDAVYDGTNVLAMIDYQTNTQFRVNIDSGYTGAGTLFLADDGNYKAAGTTINPSDNYLPVRTSSTTFGNSPLHVPSSGSTNVIADGQIIFGPGTTNAMYRSGSDFVLENDDTTGFTLNLRGTGGDATYSVGPSGSPIVSSTTPNAPVYLLSGNNAAGLMVAATSIQPITETVSIGFSSSNGAWVDQYFKGTLRQQGVNDGAGNTTSLELTHTGNAGNIEYKSAAAGTQTFRPHVFMIGSTNVAKFDTTSAAGETRFWLYDEDNGTMERVTVGVPDSGGAGFKLLRIPN